MNEILVKVAKAHENQLANPELRAEVDEVQREIQKLDLNMDKQTVYLMFVKGVYRDFEKRMTGIMLFINNTEKAVDEIHSVIGLQHISRSFQIAQARVDFDHEFLGSVEPGEAVLMHINFPVRGLNQDAVFKSNEMLGSMTDVRLAYKAIS